MTQELSFPYRPRIWTFVLVTAFFALCAIVMVQIAQKAERRFSMLFGYVDLTPEQSVYVWWFFVALNLGFVGVGILALYIRATRNHVVTLTPQMLSAPRRLWARETTQIPLFHISRVARTKVSGQTFVEINYGRNKIVLHAQSFTSNTEFERFYTALLASNPRR